ncbi:hypothetical protein FOYG_14257 [Fusarium oxysporum NRRL 32931]|uniref:Uncharacterized protein n=1 Tax=Fusarium oxysporum NRRL 32931 TaxID=660029 RepID=W9HML5_FUSOX|nr:hypothetical protein FOYG_14257 [Fusarium oxysporum NRRL 32931]
MTSPASFTSSIILGSSTIIVPSTTFSVFESSTTSDATTSTTDQLLNPLPLLPPLPNLTISATTTTKITGPIRGGPGTPCNTSNFQQVCCNSARSGTSACNLAGGNGFGGVCL